MSDAEAVIEGDQIVIRIDINNLQLIVLGGWSCGAISSPIRIDDPHAFARELVNALNAEDHDDGTTPIHRVVDRAVDTAFEYGAGEEWDEASAEAWIAEQGPLGLVAPGSGA